MVVLKSTHKKEPKSFFVNKAVLRHYSTFFDATFKKPWKEGHEGKTEFDVPVSQRVLRLVHGWMLNGGIVTDFEPDVLLKLYIYADYIGCVALQRAVVSHLQKVSKTSGGNINIISYQSLHDNKIWTEHSESGLYRFVIDTFAFHWHHEMDDSPAEADFNIPRDIPIKFAYDQLVIRTENQHAIGRGLGVGDCRCCSSVCKYHEHPSDEERLATCGATFEDKSEVLGRHWNEDADDIDEDGQDAVAEYETQEVDIEMEEGNKEVEGNGIGSESTNTENNIENTETKTSGKRKAHEDGEEEEVSTKKRKQEETES